MFRNRKTLPSSSDNVELRIKWGGGVGMNVFIGSSDEQLPVIREIVRDLKEVTDKYNIHFESWKEWFAHGEFNGWSTWKIIQQALEEFEIAIMLLAADDSVESRNQEYTMSRDNVLLEAGAFAHKCGIENVILLIPNDKSYKLPSDFLGLNCIIFDYVRGADNVEAYKRIVEKLLSCCNQMESNNENSEISIKFKITKEKNRKKIRGKLK